MSMHMTEICEHGWSLHNPTACSKCVEARSTWKPAPGYVETESFTEYPTAMLTPEIMTAVDRAEPVASSQPLSTMALALKDGNPKDALGIKNSILYNPDDRDGRARVAMLEGALKYGKFNFRSIGVRATVYTDAAMRHIASFLEGEDIDPDSGLNHITKAIASLVVLRDAMINDKFTDDRPPRPPAGWISRLNEKVAALLLKYPTHVRPYTHADNTWIEDQTI